MSIARGSILAARWMLAAALAPAVSLSSAQAAGVVGAGTPESCTEQALDDALAGGGDVTFDCGPSPHTITLSYTREISEATKLDGGFNITLDGNDSVSLFQVFADATLALEQIVLERGMGTYGAVENFGTLTLEIARIERSTATAWGGAISNYGTLTLSNSRILDNQALQGGGGIYSDGGDVTTFNSYIIGNQVTGFDGTEFGGGVWASNGLLTIDSTEIRDNVARQGGGIYTDGTVQIEFSLIENNHATHDGPGHGGGMVMASGSAAINRTRFTGNTATTGSGGALYALASTIVTINGCQFTANEAAAGAAILSDGDLRVGSSTIWNNTADDVIVGNANSGAMSIRSAEFVNTTITGNVSHGATIVAAVGTNVSLQFVTLVHNDAMAGALSTAPATSGTIQNTIIAENDPADCAAPLAGLSAGYNLVGDSSCEFAGPADQANVDPMLGPLADKGGSTPTHVPAADSAAVDGGLCSVSFPFDQRLVPRPQGEACDVGAVERWPGDDVTTTTTVTSTTMSATTTTVTTTTVPTTTTTVSTTTTTLSTEPPCGDPVGLVAGAARSSARIATASAITASDALAILNAAVGTFACELCVCDLDGSGAVTATDALAALLAAVELPVDLQCPPCE